MDITESSPERTSIALERFIAGDSLAFEGVLFSRYGGTRLEVSCFSAWSPELTTPAQATAGIARAKLVLDDLASRLPAFRDGIENLPREFYYCYDYGKGSVALAKEVDGTFEWLQTA
jgi:hypothetical protein